MKEAITLENRHHYHSYLCVLSDNMDKVSECLESIAKLHLPIVSLYGLVAFSHAFTNPRDVNYF
jgi:hypothetical protein